MSMLCPGATCLGHVGLPVVEVIACYIQKIVSGDTSAD